MEKVPLRHSGFLFEDSNSQLPIRWKWAPSCRYFRSITETRLISFAKLSVFIGRIKKTHCQKGRSAHFHAVAEDPMGPAETPERNDFEGASPTLSR